MIYIYINPAQQHFHVTTCCLPHCEFQWNSKIPQTRNSNPQLGNTNFFHCMLQMQMFQTNMGSLNRWPLLWLLVHMCFPCLSLATCQSNQQMPKIPQTHQNHASKRVQRLQKIRASLASKQHGETCCDTKTISYCFPLLFWCYWVKSSRLFSHLPFNVHLFLLHFWTFIFFPTCQVRVARVFWWFYICQSHLYFSSSSSLLHNFRKAVRDFVWDNRDIIILEIRFQKICWKHEAIILELRVTQKSFH